MQKGFTLIELLVVIAIIGILAGMVVVGMPQALKRADDATIKNAMAQFKTQAELWRTDHNGYANLACSGTPLSDPAVGAALTRVCNDLASKSANPVIGASADAYCIKAALKTGGFYCMDSTGNTTTTAATPASCDSVDTAHTTCP